VVDYPCAKFGDFGLSRFGFIVRLDGRTDRITETMMTAILTRLPSASVSVAKVRGARGLSPCSGLSPPAVNEKVLLYV